MAYTLGTLLKKAIEKSGVESEELLTLASSGDVASTEISDDEGKKFEEALDGLLTKDAALNNPEIQKHYKENYGAQQKKSLLNEIDKALFDKIGSYLDEDTVSEIKGKEKTTDKIQAAIDGIAEKQKGDANENTKKALEETKKKLQQTQEEYENKLKEEQEAKKQIENDYSQKLTYKEFKSKVSKLKFAEAYQDEDLQNMLVENAWKSITEKAQPALTEDGEIKLYRKDNPEMELYGDDNKPATVESLAEKQLAKYIAKSGGEQQKGGQKQNGEQPRNPDTSQLNQNTVSGTIAAQRAKMLQQAGK